MIEALRRAIGTLMGLNLRGGRVLGINQRNLTYVYPHNDRHFFPIADDKLMTKKTMEVAGVPMPRTYKTYQYFFELRDLMEELSPYQDFVIKPARGGGGNGIIVIHSRTSKHWIGAGGKHYGPADFQKHMSDIIFGVFSHDLKDTVIVEERIHLHPEVTRLSPMGLMDIRLLQFQDQLAMGMARIPTRQSHGRSNLHQGAVGVGIDLSSGVTTHAVLEGQEIKNHPDTGISLVGQKIPDWREVLRMGQVAAKAVPLKYIGLDIAPSVHGPVLLEINVRPGLEIQNANQEGLWGVLQPIRSKVGDRS